MRYWLQASTATLGLVIGTAGFVSPARADTSLVACTGTQHINWDPGLRLYTQEVTTSGGTNLSSCTDSEDPAITSGSSSFSGPEETSCLDLLSPPAGSETITWNTAETTTFSWTASEIVVTGAAGNLIVTITTDIESGKYAGRDIVYVLTSQSIDLLSCFPLFGNGLESASGPAVLTIS
ncbi:hypothetical protein [Streptomyces sp. NPDC005533]|uniref:hypothetical protein n=1 Tax=Streptomyces sp. NPDC005533 TaxID=3364723 RepID=UPI0036BAB65D